ncbi:hypothetical protein TcCL_ESM08754 [Trypanosoma cruzi]|nr:hypothetical protein TcCL_ESM08754 [Trypanosoma cruzi]
MRVRLRVWLLWWVLAPCALCGGRGFLPFPFGCGNELGGDGGGCFLVVCELCGWACCPLLMLSALSRRIRCAPSTSLLFHCLSFWLTDQLTDSSDSTTGGDGCDDDDDDGAAPCCVRRDGPCALVLLLLGVLDMYLAMRMRWLCRWMCRVLRVTADCDITCVCVCVCVEEVFCCQC